MLNLRGYLSLDGSGYETALKRAKSQSSKFASEVKSGVGEKLSLFLGAAAIEEFARKTVEAASRINNMSQSLGVSTDEFQQWEHAATQAGGKAENVVKFFDAIAEARDRVNEGDRKTIHQFRQFGLSQSEVQSLGVGGIGKRVGDAFKAGDAQALEAPLKDIGGKGALALRSAFKAGLDDAFKGAPLMATKDIIELDKAESDFATLGKQLMATMAPVFVWMTKGFRDVFEGLRSDVTAVGSFIGAKMEGVSNKEAAQIARESVSELNAESKKSREDAERQIEEAQKRGSGGGSSISPKLDTKPMAGILEEQRDKRSTLSVNSLQAIGARVGFDPMTTELSLNTAALRKNVQRMNELIDTLRARRTAGRVRIASGSFDDTVQYQ